MIKAVFRITLPDELYRDLLQAIRDFDMKHDPNHEGVVKIEALTEADWPAEKMAEILNAVSPAPKYTYMKKFDEEDRS